jgi:hypothetical protein
VSRQIDAIKRVTGGLRVLPDFLIIGAQRCGTSSLYWYLAQHPDVAPAVRKEVHYFDWHYRRGLLWYRAHFPLAAYRIGLRVATGRRVLTGEASPYYLVHPHAPGRVKGLLPDVKLLVLLRDPVERAVSAYHHQVRRGRESLTIDQAFAREAAVLPRELERIDKDQLYRSEFHRHFAYLARGLYADQLSLWFDVCPRERFLILSSEQFFTETQSVFEEVLGFLGLLPWRPVEYRRFNAAAYETISAPTRQRLIEHFAPHNERLYQLVGRDFGWAR